MAGGAIGGAGMGAVGGAGLGMGAAAGIGGAGATAGAGNAPKAPSASSASSASATEPSAKVTISAAAQRASVEPTQEGTTFSVTTGSDGHKYVGGMDANGFQNPDINALGQNVNELNKLDEALAALLLMLMLQKQQ